MTITQKPLSQTVYAQRRSRGAGCCPVCQGQILDVGETFAEPDRKEERFACLRCGQRWYEVYVYARYELENEHD
jgi:hypothetical protein